MLNVKFQEPTTEIENKTLTEPQDNYFLPITNKFLAVRVVENQIALDYGFRISAEKLGEEQNGPKEWEMRNGKWERGKGEEEP